MKVITDTIRFRTRITMVVVVGITALLTSLGAGGAVAGPPTYPTVDVQVGAAARSSVDAPLTDASIVGYVLTDGGGSTQRSYVQCWKDGDWATGTYRTNRWFKVWVAENPDGYYNPKWLFVNASYVYNQVIVPMC